MIVVVTGGRNYNNRAAIFAALTMLYQRYDITALHHGAASGVDTICGEWCTEWMVPCYDHPALWNDLTVPGAVVATGPYGSYNHVAGFQRNEAMLSATPRPDYGVVFPGGADTRDMKNRMIRTGLTIWEPYP